MARSLPLLPGPELIEPHGTPVNNGHGTVTVQACVIATKEDDPTRFIRLRTVVSQ